LVAVTIHHGLGTKRSHYNGSREPLILSTMCRRVVGVLRRKVSTLKCYMVPGTGRRTSLQAILFCSIGQRDSPASTIPSRGFVKAMNLNEYRHAACPHPRPPQDNRRRMPSCETPITGTTPYASPLVAYLIFRSAPVARKSFQVDRDFYQPASLRHEATTQRGIRRSTAQPHGAVFCHVCGHRHLTSQCLRSCEPTTLAALATPDRS
jgi:hypothetical protein